MIYELEILMSCSRSIGLLSQAYLVQIVFKALGPFKKGTFEREVSCLHSSKSNKRINLESSFQRPDRSRTFFLGSFVIQRRRQNQHVEK